MRGEEKEGERRGKVFGTPPTRPKPGQERGQPKGSPQCRSEAASKRKSSPPEVDPNPGKFVDSFGYILVGVHLSTCPRRGFFVHFAP